MKVGESRLTSAQAKILTKNFGYFQTQIKKGTLEEAEAMKNLPMKHVSGNHDQCGDWCLARRAKNENRTYNHPPLFDLSKPNDNKMFHQVYEIHQTFVTTERLIEMLYLSTTQANESLNMRAAELAPKYKNYSRTISLNLRINIVVGRHNSGSHNFFSNGMDRLGIKIDRDLDAWFRHCDRRKCQKKVHDSSKVYKSQRRFKWKAKLSNEIFLERTRGVKVGTYKSGVVMVAPTERKKRKPRNPCNCGGPKTHFNSNSQYCRKMKKPKKTSNDATTDITLTIPNIP